MQRINVYRPAGWDIFHDRRFGDVNNTIRDEDHVRVPHLIRFAVRNIKPQADKGPFLQ
jgi:hypothetical protein